MAQPSAILIVDDEEQNRALLRAMLKGKYRTHEAASGPQALELLDREAVDLVVLDVMMPGTTGYDTCRAIKEKQGDSFLPVLLLTALSAQTDRNLGLQAGADDFLTKPIDRRELGLRVEAFLRLRAQDRLIRQQLNQLVQLQGLKDEMLSMMVHDLRSPLSGVIALLSLMVEELPEGQWREDARAALAASDSMRAALEEMLQIRLLEEGQLPMHRAELDVHELIASAIRTVEPLARRKQIAVATDLDGIRTASLDGKLVRRAIENLLSNALKYTPSGKDIAVVARLANGAIELEVADRGPGVPSELRPKLFEKFASVEARSGGPRRGFGLGLYLVRLVAEGHRGEASVLDREGGGAVFRLTLATH